MKDTEDILDEINQHISRLSAPYDTHMGIQRIISTYKQEVQRSKAKAETEDQEG